MQHAQATSGDILERIGHRPQPPRRLARQAQRDGVDREVAALQVLLGSARPHLRQRTGPRVALGADGRQVDADPGRAYERGSEALVHGRLAAKPPGQLVRDGLDLGEHGRVQLARAHAEHQVAHGAANQLDPAALDGQRYQMGAAGQLAQALEQRGAVAGRRAEGACAIGGAQPTRTGMPAAARCAFASATVWRW